MKWLRHKLIQHLVRNLLAAISPDDILTLTNRGWFYGGRKLTPEEVVQFKEEAKAFGDSILWRIMTSEIRYQANLRMFEKGIGENTVFGRAMLYNLELLEQFIRNIKE